MKDKGYIKLKTYKNIELFINEDNSDIEFTFEGYERRVKYLFEAYRIIDEPVWEECDKEGYFMSGTFEDYIGLAKATRIDKKSKNPDWKIKNEYDFNYKTPQSYNNYKIYPRTPERDMIYKRWEKQKEVVNNEESKLKSIVSEIKL